MPTLNNTKFLLLANRAQAVHVCPKLLYRSLSVIPCMVKLKKWYRSFFQLSIPCFIISVLLVIAWRRFYLLSIFMQVRFTDTLTVFIFILDSVYRTFRRFPHCLTFPAFNFFGRSHTVYNLFLYWRYTSSNMPALSFITAASLAVFGSVSRSVAFAIPSYFCVYSLPPSHVFHIVLLLWKS